MENKSIYGNEEMKKYFRKILDDYNQTWYDKSIDKLLEYYDVKNNRLIYYDNHKNNDTYTLQEHISLVNNFFLQGKETESGAVEELIIEDFNVFSKNETACLCFITRYKSCPNPFVRTTMYLEQIEDKWKVIHVHCSFEPNI